MITVLDHELGRLRNVTLDLSPRLQGRVIACESGLIEVGGITPPIGSLCRIALSQRAKEVTAEVIGFRSGHSLMMLLGDTVSLHPGASVRPIGEPGRVKVSDALLGRAIDGSGRPIDGGSRPKCQDSWPLAGVREGALERSSIVEPFDCGIRAMNALTTIGLGQRLGIMAGSGVGKSVLIDMIAAGAKADVKVIALIGERAREVSDAVSRHLQGPEAERTIVVAVPADHAPNLRLRGAQLATSISEYFRARGQRVLLILDSLTRVAHAAREIGFLLGEPGAARGYPPSALSAITRLVERAGNSATSGGCVTGIYSVLADGDDQDDPVVDTARATFDGHIVLSRELAQQGHFPAIDVPASISRVMDELIDRDHLLAARQFRSLVSTYQTNRDLVMMGAYHAGSNPQLDRAIALQDRLNQFLQQDTYEPATLAQSIDGLQQVMRDEA